MLLWTNLYESTIVFFFFADPEHFKGKTEEKNPMDYTRNGLSCWFCV